MSLTKLIKPILLKPTTTLIQFVQVYSTYKKTSKHPFDTYKMVKRLSSEGFTQPQSKVIMQLFYSILKVK